MPGRGACLLCSISGCGWRQAAPGGATSATLIISVPPPRAMQSSHCRSVQADGLQKRLEGPMCRGRQGSRATRLIPPDPALSAAWSAGRGQQSPAAAERQLVSAGPFRSGATDGPPLQHWVHTHGALAWNVAAKSHSWGMPGKPAGHASSPVRPAHSKLLPVVSLRSGLLWRASGLRLSLAGNVSSSIGVSTRAAWTLAHLCVRCTGTTRAWCPSRRR